MLRAVEDHPAWLDPSLNEPIEDQQVNEVENEKYTEDVGKEFPEGVSSQSRGSPKQCRSGGCPDEQAEQNRYPPLLLRLGRDDLSDFLWIVS